MSQSKLVLVTGATGNQGGACVDALLSRGHRVRALTRNSDSPAAKRLRDRGVEEFIAGMHARRDCRKTCATKRTKESGSTLG